ncbi:MAG TPA: hypothetical protein VFN35_36720, partial [Ktedonobacteraceae bacterium]|nr:hypothetical protein [Ktedonobacteraceae bacterium]
MGNLQLDQLTMSDLNNLETAAGQASSLVGTFNSTASDLMTKSNKLEQTARDLTLGSGGWVGQASLAFFGAWSRSKLDSLKCSAGLIRAAGTLDGLSKSIDQYVPTIRLGVQAHQEQQTNPPSNATIADHFDDLMQQGQNALFTLAGLIDQLASELEDAARELGVCSASDSQVDAYDLLAPPSLMNKASAEEDEAEMIALAESLEAQGVDSELAVDIALEAVSKELDLKGVQALIDKGATPQEVLSLIKDGKITEANLGTLPLLLERSGGDLTITQIANRM